MTTIKQKSVNISDSKLVFFLLSSVCVCHKTTSPHRSSSEKLEEKKRVIRSNLHGDGNGWYLSVAECFLEMNFQRLLNGT